MHHYTNLKIFRSSALSSSENVLLSILLQNNVNQKLKSWQQMLSNPDNYPSAACVSIAHPYQAKTVITEVYQQMWTRWQQKLHER